MTDLPLKHYWRGQDVDTLSRETLIEIINHLSLELASARSCVKSLAEINELGRKFRGRAA